MLRCNEVTRLVASERLQTAGLMTRLGVRMHLMVCRYCRRYVAQLRAIGRAARGLAEGDPAQREAVHRLIRALQNQPD
jgi:hypothetical protein